MPRVTAETLGRPSGRNALGDALAEATGQLHRPDPALPTTGGPAGNARLTAWTGLLLLVLSLAELASLLDVREFLSWHIVVGVLLVPPALLKTASAGWRVARYYRGAETYVSAGPPPLVLRILGPLVVASTLALLGTGVWLVALGQDGSRHAWFDVLGHAISPITLHQGAFLVWIVATSLHVLGRLIPAVSIALGVNGRPGRVAGGQARTALIVFSLAVGGAAAGLVLSLSTWAG